MTLFIAEILAIVFVAFWLINFCTCFTFGRLVGRHGAVEDNFPDVPLAELPPLSIVVVAHNQADVLRKNLPLLLEQDYGTYEVIVVNDNSTDDTEEMLNQMQKRYMHLYHTFTPSSAIYISHSILSITLGVKAAKYDWVVFTSPDCRPQSFRWLRLLSRHFVPGVDIVLGYSNYVQGIDLFSKNIIFDRLYQQSFYLTRALHGRAFRGNGCNLAYRKTLFMENRGLSDFVNLMGGEDALFVNANATRTNVRVECHRDAIVRQSLPFSHKTWSQDKLFYMETRRHFQHKFASRFFFNFYMTMLVLFYISFFIAAGAAIMLQQWVLLGGVVLLYILYRISKTYRFSLTARALGERSHAILFPFYEFSVLLRNSGYLLLRKFYRNAYFRKR